jgi:hypothetical protein
MGRVQLAWQQQGRSGPLPVNWNVHQRQPDLVASLRDDFWSFMRIGLADSNVRSCDSQEKQYRRFCGMLGLQDKPSADVLARFAVGSTMDH